MAKRKNPAPEVIGNPADPQSTAVFTIGKVFATELKLDANAASNADTNIRELAPQVKYEFRIDQKALPNNIYEVHLNIQADASVNGTNAYSSSLKQTGFFTVANCTAQQLDFILRGYCPTILYPYARENLSNLISRGGFKPFELPAIDFLSVYQKTLQAQVEQRKVKP